MDELLLKVKFGIKAKIKKPATSTYHKADTVKIFDRTINVSNVVIVTLTQDSQHLLKCKIGEQLTYRKPYTKINKTAMVQNLETEEIIEEYEPFTPYKQHLMDYPDEDVLVIQAVDEMRLEDAFYLCLDHEEANMLIGEMRAIEREQEQRIANAVNKMPKRWTSLGSENEVDLNVPKTSRGLYKIELYTKYPLKTKRTLRLELAGSKQFDQADLTIPEKYAKEIVQRRRTDAEVQTKMVSFNKKAQTTYNYPKNMWTQYEYNYEPIENIEGFPNESFASKCFDLKSEMLVNSNVNFYTDDYACLGGKISANGSNIVERREYMSVIDVKSREKIITDFVWHPLISGIVAIAYGCESSLVYKNCDDFDQEKPVYEEFSVLIWDINDTFHPKLKLACDTEIQTLSFCPHAENVLIGGGKNGRIFYWNLFNKLNTNNTHALTARQKANRTKLYAIMRWKDHENIPVIPISAKTEMAKSHRSSVTGISWLCNEEEERSKFMTASVDGYIKVWDLKAIVYAEGGNKLTRLQQNNVGVLSADFSKKLLVSGVKNAYPIRCITQPRFDVEYNECKQDSCGQFEAIRRTFVLKNKPGGNVFLLTGTDFGDLITSSWGDEDKDEEEVDRNVIQVLNTARLHDGPVNSIEQHPFLSEFYLTAGGKVFVIWKIVDDTLKPVFWRRSKYFYTHAHWSLYQATGFRLNRSDGNREIWDLSIKSDSYHYLNSYSGKALLKAAVHPFKIEKNLFALADEQGALRLIYVPKNLQNIDESCAKMKDILENNYQLKNSLSEWQTFWVGKYASHLIEDKQRLELQRIRKEKEAHKERIRLKEKLAREAELAAQLAELKKRPPPGQRAEWAHRKWIEREHKTLSSIMLNKKKLDRNTLKEERKPVQIKHNEKVRLLIKKREKLAESDVIFRKTIEAAFPVISEKNAVKCEEVIVDKEDLLKQYMQTYKEVSFNCEKFVHEHPFISEVNWSTALLNILMKKKDHESRIRKSRRYRIKMEKVDK